MIHNIVAKQITPVWVQFGEHALSPAKEMARAFLRPGVERQRYLPPWSRDDTAKRTAIALDASFDLRPISRIFVVKDQNYPNHVIIGINHG